MIGAFELEQGIANMPPPSMLNLVLMALFAMICGSFVYTSRSVDKIWKYLTNHLSDKVAELVKKELDKK